MRKAVVFSTNVHHYYLSWFVWMKHKKISYGLCLLLCLLDVVNKFTLY